MKKLLGYVFTFLTIATQVHSNNITWSNTPDILSDFSVNASDAQIATDSSGNLVAVWIENNSVKASSKQLNESWTPKVSLSAANSSSVVLVSDKNGNATAVWTESGTIKSATKSLFGSWSSVTSISNNGSSSPALCVSDSGDVIAAWNRSNNVETSTKPFGGSWQTKTSFSNTSATRPTIAVGGTGSSTRVIIVWQGTVNGVKSIFSTAKPLPGSWTNAVRISDMDQNAAQPTVAVDPSGNALALWYDYELVGGNYYNVVLKTAVRDAASSDWSTNSALSEPGIRNPASLAARVKFDSIGNAVAMWNNSYDDETFNIETAVKPANSNWSGVKTLVASNLYAYSADVASTAFGDVLGLYMFYNGNALMLQSIESDINGFMNNIWSVPVTISLGTNNAFPKIVATLSGNSILAAAIWLNNDGSHNHVTASTGTKTLVLPPSNLNVSQSQNNFGVITDYYNTLTWDASADPNAAGYLIFRNGVYLAEVGTDTLQYIDNNRVQNGPVTYSVTTIDNEQTQSRTVSVTFP